ncbi:Ser-Thr-rich glycosyl-phosphatidyl-inositol-anchored membrane family-domain-containing protein [Emericellopsis atlantica]|uniref:Ser-Thr-rich glycosyl-phosphatidyl-inositol-anchored membrane family-domain-containing protein n=1 Tax=Emericellopsis atlantica TaxID=2614577 RepID=A0A9P8CV08_9HYPO|nr:Ser-Thr-rich glycosyl-phosphatidyl-inositol-anchored membrane family-domain-containing protein [Emericellopsis atlantica]KAG9257926.1 Ser-Thr-rich glycosyl-phosphatidyl-inositol-anchored membrane family-domain-containing protein [Emericellopsis atlantica]
MRFSASAVLAFAASVLAQTPGFDPIYTPGLNQEVPAGKTFEITWQATDPYKDANIKISLIGGASQGTQQPIKDIASGVKNSAQSFSWAVDASLGADAVYGLIISLADNSDVFQYSTPFQITQAEADNTEAASTEASQSTVVKTTAEGIKTISLTSCPPAEPTVPTMAPIVTPSSFPHANTTSIWVTSTVKCTACEHVPSQPPAVPTTEVYVPEPIPEPSYSGINPSPVPEEPTTTPVPVPGAANAMVAGPLAIFGGLAVAMLAL